MITFWCKIMVLQMLITTITHSTKLEFDDDPKLSNKNIIWLFNKFIEDINNQHDTEDPNDKIDQMKDIYHQISLLPVNREQHFNKQTENDDVQQSTIEDQIIDNIGHFNKKRGKSHYMTTLCHFKICNKRSMDNYGNLIRFANKNYVPLY